MYVELKRNWIEADSFATACLQTVNQG